MNSKLLLFAGFLVLNLCLGACTNTPLVSGDEDGIGGTGIVAEHDPDGVGGTGIADPDVGETDGIGGTGVRRDSGDVALFGVITALDPLVINGHGMVIDDTTVISVNGQAAEITAIEPGAVAWAKIGLRDGTISAIEIRLQAVMQGQVTQYENSGGVLDVGGQQIRISQATKLVGNVLTPGEWVEVYGVYDFNGQVQASLLMPTSDTQFKLFQKESLQLPFKGEVASYSVQGFAALSGANLMLAGPNRNAITLQMVPGSLETTPQTIERPVIIEFKPTEGEQFKLRSVQPVNGIDPNRSIIPEYRPPSPSGVILPGRGVHQLPGRQPKVTEQINTDVGSRRVPSGQTLNLPGTTGPAQPADRVINRVPAVSKPVLPPTSSPASDALPAARGP